VTYLLDVLRGVQSTRQPRDSSTMKGEGRSRSTDVMRGAALRELPRRHGHQLESRSATPERPSPRPYQGMVSPS
jgi:hypothetical protein